jgi:hypothetical protein
MLSLFEGTSLPLVTPDLELPNFLELANALHNFCLYTTLYVLIAPCILDLIQIFLSFFNLINYRVK